MWAAPVFIQMPKKVLLAVMVVVMGGLISSLPLEAKFIHRRLLEVKTCPAGQYIKNNDCSPCSDGTYTSKTNSDRSCLSCFKDCLKEFNRKVLKPCTNVSDMVCVCMDGFECASGVTEQKCHCVPKSTTTITITTAHITTKENTTSSASGTEQHYWIIYIILFSICICFGFTICLCRQRNTNCLKRWVKRCPIVNQKESSNITSFDVPTHIKQLHNNNMPQDSNTSTSANAESSSYHPTSTENSFPANIGPLHIHGAGTVFVSLLNQFGLNGGDKDEEPFQQESEIQSPTSPTLPLSTEEKNRDNGYISFPFQEQGKECHISKEEGL